MTVTTLRRVHFVGIGGAGMSGIARILLAQGSTVSGSDAKDSRALAALRALGAEVYLGHDPSHVGNVDAVVASTAIRPTNPELVEAIRRGLPILPRAAALAAVMVGYRGVAVAGTHGKTTTTSLLTVALQHCGVDPSFAIGGDLNEAGSNAHQGTGTIFVAEADESDGSFLLLSPTLAIVTNVEADHLDYYADAEAVAEAFRSFLGRLPADGVLVASADDQGSMSLARHAQELGLLVRTYGTAVDADLQMDALSLHESGSSWSATHLGRRLGEVRIQLPGEHNARNAAGALLAGLELGQTFASLVEGLESFTGVRRRFEIKGTADGVRVIDDYAHHPTEVAATLRAARIVVGSGRVVVAFQPHRYSRTAVFAAQLGEALGLADEIVVMEVYAAGEDAIPGVSGATVAAAVPLPAEHVAFEPSWSAVAHELVARTSRGDVVLTLGAGDVTQLGPEVLRALEERAGARCG